MENRTSSLFLIDEKNNKQLPKLINFLERKGGEIADNVLDICQVSLLCRPAEDIR